MARRKQAFISLISLISVLGVAVGVMALLIALALMTGLQGELRDRIIGSAAHVYVFKVGGIQDVDDEVARMLKVPRVQGAAPALLGKAMITSEKGRLHRRQGHRSGARDDGHAAASRRCARDRPKRWRAPPDDLPAS